MPPKASRRKGKKPGPKKRGGFGLGGLFGGDINTIANAAKAFNEYKRQTEAKRGGKRKRGGFDYTKWVSPGSIMLRAPPPKFKLMPLNVTM
jgi:hypothetical protein